MTLKYSDDDVTDEGVKGVKLADSCPTVYDAARCAKQNYPTSISATLSYFTGTLTR